MIVTINDIVFRNDDAGIIVACVLHHEDLYVTVDKLLVSKVLSSTAVETVRLMNCRETWPIADVVPAVAWYESDFKIVIIRGS